MARVVVCTVARPLVRVLVRGGVLWCSGFGHDFVVVYGMDAIIGRCNSLGGKALTHVLMRGLAASVEQSIVTIVLVGCNSCFIKKRIPLHRFRCRGMLF